MKEKFDITIAGTEMTVLSEDTEEYVKRLAHILDRRVTDLVIVKKSCTKVEALALCALDYLDMAMKLKAELEDLKGKNGEN
jgi:cell division protein ZapA (FtsZ GTPase activity inhibitor)